MAKKTKDPTVPELLQEMHSKGVEQQIPSSGRIIRLRTIDAPQLLKEGKMPDILTPLVIKAVYEDLSDRELRGFLGQQRGNAAEALAMLEAIDFVVEKSIADGTKLKDLTIGEKRWIFRLAMEPAEMLVSFRYDPNADVEPVAEGEDVQPATEPDTGGD